ncbi:MAG: hypothetical protein AAF431_11025 [Pseudomonadota bacterium]
MGNTKCRFCLEPIDGRASVCKHCGNAQGRLTKLLGVITSVVVLVPVIIAVWPTLMKNLPLGDFEIVAFHSDNQIIIANNTTNDYMISHIYYAPAWSAPFDHYDRAITSLEKMVRGEMAVDPESQYQSEDNTNHTYNLGLLGLTRARLKQKPNCSVLREQCQDAGVLGKLLTNSSSQLSCADQGVSCENNWRAPLEKNRPIGDSLQAQAARQYSLRQARKGYRLDGYNTEEFHQLLILGSIFEHSSLDSEQGESCMHAFYLTDSDRRYIQIAHEARAEDKTGFNKNDATLGVAVYNSSRGMHFWDYEESGDGSVYMLFMTAFGGEQADDDGRATNISPQEIYTQCVSQLRAVQNQKEQAD